MLIETAQYDKAMVEQMDLKELKSEEISKTLEAYLGGYSESMRNRSQRKYFGAFVKGLLSDLERKSIEPIALSILDETEVRGFQQFFKRSVLEEKAVRVEYQHQLSTAISDEGGMLCVDGSDFVKKGQESAGVYRQHCGRLGKTENCQAGVFTSYVSSKGYGLVEGRLYMPKRWFSEEYAERMKRCEVPKEITFQTKNEIASEMIRAAYESGELAIEWVGCDAAFGCDHKFLERLPEGLKYFAATKEIELVFLDMPEMIMPENPRTGRRYQYPRPSISPIRAKAVAEDPSIPWELVMLGPGTKGPIYAHTKCVRCVSCIAQNDHGNHLAPGIEIWLYIRRYEDGSLKYFISNAPKDTERDVLNKLATMRWSIEQCFEECKSYLGMTHYETRTYQAWHRHMLLVMIAHLFTIILRQTYKKTLFDHAYG